MILVLKTFTFLRTDVPRKRFIAMKKGRKGKKRNNGGEEETLPLELWCEVFSYLTTQESLGVRGVCSTWNSVILEERELEEKIRMARIRHEEVKRMKAELKSEQRREFFSNLP